MQKGYMAEIRMSLSKRNEESLELHIGKLYEDEAYRSVCLRSGRLETRRRERNK